MISQLVAMRLMAAAEHVKMLRRQELTPCGVQEAMGEQWKLVHAAQGERRRIKQAQ
jgi:hypothetical protein